MLWILADDASIDPSDPTTWLTAGLLAVLLAIFVADKILEHLKTRGIDLKELYRWVKELHEWHDHDDPDQAGVKIWWNQKYLADLIKEHAKGQAQLVQLLSEMRRENKRQNNIQEKQIELLSNLIRSQESLQRTQAAMHSQLETLSKSQEALRKKLEENR